MPRDARKLTPKQARFVQEYLVDMNAAAAYTRAGYAIRGASANAARMIANDSIQSAIAEAQKRRIQRTEIDQDAVIRELEHMAMFRRGDLVDDAGSLLPWHDMPERGKAVVMDEYTDEVGNRRVRTVDKTRNMETLLKHLGLHSGSKTGATVQTGVILLPEEARDAETWAATRTRRKGDAGR